jgi:hypothetical protein
MQLVKRRKLVFAIQPTDVVNGATSEKIRLSVVDENGDLDLSCQPPIRLQVEDAAPAAEDRGLRPLAAIPMRLRAVATGCEDAISNVFYLLPK